MRDWWLREEWVAKKSVGGLEWDWWLRKEWVAKRGMGG
jgi:hypothetical protein